MSAVPRHSPQASGEGLVRISLESLLRLNQDASGIKLGQSRQRSAQSGNYLSRFKGRGMEFDETRPYTPGDDIRNLDWRVTARTGRTHTKLFREERERPVFLSVDARSPMFFATRGVFKSVLAARLAALVAWSSVHHGDRVGGQIFSETGSREIRPEHGRRAVLPFLHKLSRLEAVESGLTPNPLGFEEAMARLNRHARPGSLVFIFSDFRGWTAGGESNLIRLRRHCDAALVMIADPFEATLPDSGRLRLAAGIRELLLDASPAVAAAQAARFDERLGAVQRFARIHGMRFALCRTTDDPLHVLQSQFGSTRRKP
jgi:uncharacterized protein (DUF58 family)